MNATYGKLDDGTWGLRVEGGVPGVGASITVQKKDGSTKTEQVGSILWQGTTRSGKPGALCTIASKSRGSSGGSRRSRGARYCEGWGADNPHVPRPPYTCDECGHDGY